MEPLLPDAHLATTDLIWGMASWLTQKIRCGAGRCDSAITAANAQTARWARVSSLVKRVSHMPLPYLCHLETRAIFRSALLTSATPDADGVYLETSTVINSGDELLFDYGGDFWSGALPDE